jgi:peptide/nickel transport system substrate-binding protein
VEGHNPQPRHGGRRRRQAAALIGAVSLSLTVVTACGSSATSTNKAGDVLTIAFPLSPTTLDPAKTSPANRFFEQLAYQPLVVHRSDGTFQPGLATSWKYVGTGNSTFVLTLRPGVKFADGGDLTAQAVVDHFNYVLKSAGQSALVLKGDSFSASGPLEVTIKTAKPNPDLAYALTQDNITGDVISPKGLSDPARLGTATFGAGPYQLDGSRTVAGSQYTFVPNANYYDKPSVHWKKVVIKIISSPQSTLQALQTGQANLSQGVPSTLAAAKQAGLNVSMANQLVAGVTLADRGGKISKPLGEVRVRQALNYATDRDSITKALFPGLGSSTQQLNVPGGYGFTEALNHTYTYDVAKAKSLLAAAGYPNGFTLDLLTSDTGDLNLLAQALGQQWQKIGVTVKIQDIPNPSAYQAAVAGARSPAFTNNFAPQPVATQGPNVFLPNAPFNPFHYEDTTLQSLYDQDVAATGSAKTALDQQIAAYLVQQAWFVPVAAEGLPFYSTKNITGTTVSATSPYVSLYEVRGTA